jgi:hypothetical protein
MSNGDSEGFSIKMQLLHASYYQHMKGAEEMARIGMLDRAKVLRDESNRLSEEIHKLKEIYANEQKENNSSND